VTGDRKFGGNWNENENENEEEMVSWLSVRRKVLPYCGG
jgi:hypothetical protein